MFETVDDFQASLKCLTKRNEAFFTAAFDRQKQLTKPLGSLGKLEEYACFMAAWQGNERPEIKLAQALIFAGNHGVQPRRESISSRGHDGNGRKFS